ncbi:Nose resistant to fluoxetine protein 6 [Papilio xuthus]|uniref:Nose resistant to fluoxetine protein 6 n=1 Tax=Papilio xuthus TaxID=66420 RepID=A0A194QES6_PAPXU|nr:Nose resistant to fluoxetine protein 6 [Papilio xuthus]
MLDAILTRMFYACSPLLAVVALASADQMQWVPYGNFQAYNLHEDQQVQPSEFSGGYNFGDEGSSLSDHGSTGHDFGGQSFGGHDFGGHDLKAHSYPVHQHVEEENPEPVKHYKEIVVPVHKNVEFKINQPVLIPVPHPVPIQVPVPKAVVIPIIKEVSIPVEKSVPYPVEKTAILRWQTKIRCVILEIHIGNNGNAKEAVKIIGEYESYIDIVRKDLLISSWTEEEKPCLNQILKIIDNVKNTTIWATWIWDSIQLPVGQLYGSKEHYGNYDQCLSEKVADSLLPFRTQYCRANIIWRTPKEKDIYINEIDPYLSLDEYIQTRTFLNLRFNTLSWGVCVPEICQKKSVKTFVSALFKQSHLSKLQTPMDVTINNCEPAGEVNKHVDGHYYLILIWWYMATLLIIFFVLPRFGCGPLCDKYFQREGGACYKTWWLGLLMIGNYVELSQICYPSAWYVYCDFHMSVVGIILLWIFQRNRRIGMTCFIILTVLSTLFTALAIYDFPELTKLKIDFETFNKLRTSENYSMVAMYTQTHNRAIPYIIGMGLGYIMSNYKEISFQRITKNLHIILAVIVAGILSYPFISMSDNLKVALLLVLMRYGWAMFVCAIIALCEYGKWPSMKGFLSWSIFAPLSKLTYGIYFIHFLTLTSNMISTRGRLHYNAHILAERFFGQLTLSAFISLFFLLFIEAPLNNLVQLCLKSIGNKQTKVKLQVDNEYLSNELLTEAPSIDEKEKLQ